MSEADKGDIMRQIQQLPPIMQARLEGFVEGITASIAGGFQKPVPETAADGEEKTGEVKSDGS